MSNYDKFLDQGTSSTSGKKSSPDTVWNVLTVAIVLMTLCACAFFVTIAVNPESGLNPFPPFTQVPPPPTATWTPLGYDATWTPTVTVQPTETSTPRPTFTLEPSITPFSLASPTSIFTNTPAATATKTPRPTGVPFTVTVTFNDSTTFRADTSCASMFVAGQVLGAGNSPLQGYQVKLGGGVPGKTFVPALTTLSGIAPVYGPSGFEFNLGIQPVASNKTLWIQLYDQSGAALSEQYQLTTYNDCKKNLIFVRFQQK